MQGKLITQQQCVTLIGEKKEEHLLDTHINESIMSHNTRYFGHADILPIMKVHSICKTYNAIQYCSLCRYILAVEKGSNVKKRKQFNLACQCNVHSNLDLYT